MTLMQQYHAAKARHPNMLLLFRWGDFIELFDADAETAARLLGLTLTRRDQRPMAGFPHHALEAYLHKLLKAGQRVAICDPAETTAQPVERIVVPDSEPAPALPAPTRPSMRQALFDDEDLP
jgi:DNA mismatch repair protein MutS